MDQLKQPVAIVTGANSLAIIGTSIYFYRQINTLQAAMKEVITRMGGVNKVIDDFNKGQTKMGEIDAILKGLQTSMGKLTKTITRNSTRFEESIESMEDEMEAIREALEKAGIKVERSRPKPSPRRQVTREPPKRKSRRSKKEKDESESESEEEEEDGEDLINAVRKHRKEKQEK